MSEEFKKSLYKYLPTDREYFQPAQPKRRPFFKFVSHVSSCGSVHNAEERDRLGQDTAASGMGEAFLFVVV